MSEQHERELPPHPVPGDETFVTRGLKPTDFVTFFRDVHGHSPFPWQQRLTEQVLRDEAWPGVIDLPTGTGKTAVLDTAIFAMAANPRVSPRRVVFVIDRRIVVDQVYRRAEEIKGRIEAADTPILKMVRDQLKELSGGSPLGVAALQGGVPIDNEWADRPDQPWVMVSTVDQFGSRLLFRGYGVGWRMRPVHAGLAGNDCLVILDEVHLSLPFAETLARVFALKCGRIPRRFGIVEMSATPRDSNEPRFTLDPVADLKHCEELRRRVQAAKQAELISVRNQDALPTAVLKKVNSISKARQETGTRSIGIVVNRVRTARNIYQLLEQNDFSASLLTGRMRPLDRLDVLGKVAANIDPDAEEQRDNLTILVATQAIEVGADFSFDALITECAPIDSLRQRFGRLDRRGRGVGRTGAPAQAWIIGPKSVVASKGPDPIYGNSAKLTWKELEHRRDDNGQIDIGTLSLQDFPNGATAPRASAPLLLMSHMDAWVQTKPEPIVQPSLEWFLHGIDDERVAEPDVSIVWRWDTSQETLALVPPRPAEFLQVPISAARSWLVKGSETDVADVDSTGTIENGSYNGKTKPSINIVRWEGFAEAPRKLDNVDEIRPGDVLMAEPGSCGISAGTWDPSSPNPVTDLGDAAQLAYGRRITLRLDKRLYSGSNIPAPNDESEAASSARNRIEQLLSEWRRVPDPVPDWAIKAISKFGGNFEIRPVGLKDELPTAGYYVLTNRKSGERELAPDPATMDGSDDSGAFTGTGASLKGHLESVADRAGNIAQRLGCAKALVEDLRLAGRLHDIGKVDRRFQCQLVGGDAVELEMLAEPLAKSLPGAPRVWRYPKGMRHELASVAMIESNPAVLESAHDPDLVLHLVGTHHGWSRPLPPLVEDREAQMLSCEIDGHAMNVSSDLVESSLALDMADRFWRVVERYGHHGLAWLEAILRLADHQVSAE